MIKTSRRGSGDSNQNWSRTGVGVCKTGSVHKGIEPGKTELETEQDGEEKE